MNVVAAVISQCEVFMAMSARTASRHCARPVPLVCGIALLIAAISGTLGGCARTESAAPVDVTSKTRRIAAQASTTVDAAQSSDARAQANAEMLFPGRRDVTVSELFAALSSEADALGRAQTLRQEYETLLAKHRLQGDDRLYADYVRVRLAFETTRAGGLWGLEWQVTDRLPQSDAVWAQWRSIRVANTTAIPTTTAIAECDELSALFAVVARGIGLSRRSQVGLLWPTSNHTVAVWVIDDANSDEHARIVVPTSQIFLDSVQSLDTDGFDPWRQPRVYDYTRRDIVADATLPAPLARYFLAQAQRYGARSRGELQGMRNRRAYDQRRAMRL